MAIAWTSRLVVDCIIVFQDICQCYTCTYICTFSIVFAPFFLCVLPLLPLLLVYQRHDLRHLHFDCDYWAPLSVFRVRPYFVRRPEESAAYIEPEMPGVRICQVIKRKEQEQEQEEGGGGALTKGKEKLWKNFG